jgi:glutathione S-transferase
MNFFFMKIFSLFFFVVFQISVMVLQLYIDWLSEPCRAVAVLLLENHIEHEVHELSVLKGETHSDAYKQINPVGKVPAIVDDGFSLSESHTIMRYLCASRKLPDHYYPNDIKQRARVDSWLDWHHTNLRQGALRLIKANIYGPMKNFSQATIDELRKEGDSVLKSSLSFMEENLSKNNYIAGGNQFSVADIALACEVAMFPVYGASSEGYPNVQAWIKRLSTEIKSWDQANAKLDQYLAAKKK